MEYGAMITLLKEGGIDVETFDSRSAKSLCDLHKEIDDKEVVLCLRGNQVCRVAQTIKILIIVGDSEYIGQIKRVYPSGKIVYRKGMTSISETKIRGEDIDEAVKRGMREECGIVIDDSQIAADVRTLAKISTHINAPDMLPHIDEHASSVYEGIITVSLVDVRLVRLTERPWSHDTRIIDDNGVQIHLGFFDLGIPTAILTKIGALK